MITKLPLLLAALLLASCGDPITGIVDTEDIGPGTPNILVDVTGLDFGIVPFGESVSSEVVVENVGDGDLTLTSIIATEPFSTSYTQSISMNGNSAMSLNVRYQALDFVADVGTLTIQCTDEDTPTIQVALSAGVITDEDGDGVDSIDAGGTDCDDTESSINPNASESWYDGIDENCDGDDDYDQDNDGFQHIYYFPDISDGGGDCNDMAADVYPGALDVWYDNVDSNCDARNDWDADGDGVATTLGDHGTDCDDTNSQISPNIEEVAANKIDDDCDGRVDE